MSIAVQNLTYPTECEILDFEPDVRTGTANPGAKKPRSFGGPRLEYPCAEAHRARVQHSPICSLMNCGGATSLMTRCVASQSTSGTNSASTDGGESERAVHSRAICRRRHQPRRPEFFYRSQFHSTVSNLCRL